MSEFPEWVERTLGITDLTSRRAREIHFKLDTGQWPDPRGRGKRIWWRHLWFFNRRRR